MDLKSNALNGQGDNNAQNDVFDRNELSLNQMLDYIIMLQKIVKEQ